MDWVLDSKKNVVHKSCCESNKLYECMECGSQIIYVNNNSIKFFKHINDKNNKNKNHNKCSGNVSRESNAHKVTKNFIYKYIKQIRLYEPCIICNVNKKYYGDDFEKAIIEYPLINGKYRADIGVINDKNKIYAIEIVYSNKSSIEKIKDLRNNGIEILELDCIKIINKLEDFMLDKCKIRDSDGKLYFEISPFDIDKKHVCEICEIKKSENSLKLKIENQKNKRKIDEIYHSDDIINDKKEIDSLFYSDETEFEICSLCDKNKIDKTQKEKFIYCHDCNSIRYKLKTKIRDHPFDEMSILNDILNKPEDQKLIMSIPRMIEIKHLCKTFTGYQKDHPIFISDIEKGRHDINDREYFSKAQPGHELNVYILYKDDAKKMGCVWNPEKKKWLIPKTGMRKEIYDKNWLPSWVERLIWDNFNYWKNITEKL